MTKRILLVEPPFFRLFKDGYSLDRYPLGLAYLAATVHQETAWDVTAYNADFSGESEQIQISHLAGPGFTRYREILGDPRAAIWQEIRAVINELRPDIVGISSKSQNFASASRVASIVKDNDPATLVVVGGVHASVRGAEILEHAAIDAAVQGEGERTLVALLDAVESGGTFENIPGVIYRNGGANGVTRNEPRAPVADLDMLPFPHESAAAVLKDYDRYPKSAFRHIFATRGCPHTCTFCASREVWGQKVRFRSPANVVAEIQSLRQRGLQFVHFSDDTFGVTRNYIKQLCSALLADCPGIQWSCETHVSLVDEESVSLMKRAGCHSIEIGIESGSNEILRTIRKNSTIEQALAACKTIKQSGIEVVALFMVGFPDETEASLEATIDAMQRARCDRIHYSVFTPYPGSPAYELCRERGLIGEDHDVSRYGHQSPENCFCSAISPERFRSVVSGVERMVDRKNTWSRARRLFSTNGLRRAKEAGLRQSFRKVVRFFFGV